MTTMKTGQLLQAEAQEALAKEMALSRELSIATAKAVLSLLVFNIAACGLVPPDPPVFRDLQNAIKAMETR